MVGNVHRVDKGNCITMNHPNDYIASQNIVTQCKYTYKPLPNA